MLAASATAEPLRGPTMYTFEYSESERTASREEEADADCAAVPLMGGDRGGEFGPRRHAGRAGVLGLAEPTCLALPLPPAPCLPPGSLLNAPFE